MTSVGEDFPQQQERVRKLWGEQVKRGPIGAPGAAAMEEVLGRAASAQSSGDILLTQLINHGRINIARQREEYREWLREELLGPEPRPFLRLNP